MKNARTIPVLCCLVAVVVATGPVAPPAAAQEIPTLPWGTYFGGSDLDGWTDVPIVEAADGTLYIASATLSADLALPPGGWDPTHNGDRDLIVAHFDADLTTLLHATYVGGSGADSDFPGVDLALAGDGTVYVVSASESTDYPTTAGAFAPGGSGGYDLVVTRLNADLSEVLASTYLGGSDTEGYCKIAVRPDGDVEVVCASFSLDYPVTEGACQTVRRGARDLALSRLSPDLTTLVSSTYLGSSADEFPEAIVIGPDNEAFVTGWTRSSYSFPTTEDAFMPHAAGGIYQAFVSCLPADLSSLTASTYISGNSWEFGYGLALADDGTVYACGHTASTDFPGTAGGAQPNYAGAGGADVGDDMWIARFSHDLTTLLAATYLGGSAWENAIGLATTADAVYVCGNTSSADGPTTAGAFRTTIDGGTSRYGRSTTVIRLDRDLATIEAATFLGGAGNDPAGRILRTHDGRILIAGATNSRDYPVPAAAWADQYAGGVDELSGDVIVVGLDADLTGQNAAPVTGRVPEGSLRLEGAAPNPFNPRTEIRFAIDAAHRVRATVHDLAGRRIATLADRDFSAGSHRLVWDGKDAGGGEVGSGVYFYRLEAGGVSRCRSMVLVR